jgi:hypothetical protein
VNRRGFLSLAPLILLAEELPLGRAYSFLRANPLALPPLQWFRREVTDWTGLTLITEVYTREMGPGWRPTGKFKLVGNV